MLYTRFRSQARAYPAWAWVSFKYELHKVAEKALLKIDHISKRFGAVVALENASFELHTHSVHALLGANGSGKSTLVKILSGMLKADSGTIQMDDKPVQLSHPKAAREAGISIAFQELSLLPNLTVAQNVMLGVEVRNQAGYISRRRVELTATEALERVGIHMRADEVVGSLSSAQLQLVEIAKAIVRQPRYLVLDESTASLRHQEVQHLFKVVRELRDSGVGILMVSHRFDEIYDLCDTATVLCGGVSSGPFHLSQTPQDVLVAQMVGGKPSAISHGPEPAAVKDPKLESVNTQSRNFNAGVVRVKIENLTGSGLKGVNLGVHAGEILGLGGLQGQGQGQLLRGLIGAANVRTELRIDDVRIRARSPHQAARKGIVFISGDRRREGIFPDRSLEENITVTNFGTTSLWKMLAPIGRDSKVKEIMERLQVVHASILQQASGLSGGNQQKLLVGRALYNRPKLLVLDDPTKGVDVTAREEIHRLLKNIASQGVPVILASSDDHELSMVCDRVAILYDGRVATEISSPMSSTALTEASIEAAQGRAQVTM